jgi:hypothetical protein
MARLGAFDKTYSQRGWFDATYGDPPQGWLDATAIGLQGTEAVTAYGVWIQYAFFSGIVSAIGYRQPTFVTLIAGEQSTAPQPTSQPARVPTAAPTPEAPTQGPVGTGVGYKPPTVEAQGGPPAPPPAVAAGPMPTSTSLRTAPVLEIPSSSPVAPTPAAPIQGPTAQGSRVTAPAAAPAPRTPEPAPTPPTPTQGPTPKRRS